MPKSRIAIWSSLSFISGIAVSSFLAIDFWPYRLYLFTAAIICLIFLVSTRHDRKRYFLVGVCLFLGIWRFSLSDKPFTTNEIGYFGGHYVEFDGVVAGDPEESYDGQKSIIAAERLVNVDGRRISGENITGSVSAWTSGAWLVYGQKVHIHCRLDNSASVLGGSYAGFIRTRGLQAVCAKTEARILSQGSPDFLHGKIGRLRRMIADAIRSSMPSPESSLAIGVFLGGSSTMDDATKIAFSRAGLTHLVAVSGLNITIMSLIILNTLFFVGISRRPAFYIASSLLLFYVILVGAPASATRAGIMGFILLWALHLGRVNRLDNSLWLAAAAMLLANPLLLRGDIGFILSFLSMAAIVYINPRLENFFDRWRVPEMKGLRPIFSVALSAQIATMPIVAYNFAQVSLVSIIANILVEWTSVWLLIAVLVGTTTAWLFGAYGRIVFMPAFILCKYVISIARWLGSSRLAAWQSGSWPWLIAAIYYFLLFVWIFGPEKKMVLRK